MATSIFSRKRDLVYLTYFCIAVPIAFIVDMQPLYPASLIPAWMSGLSEFYVNTYHDKFFIDTPPFFEFFMWTELFIQIPVEIWGIGALLRNSPMVPLVLLPFACLIFITTATCMYEYAHWDAPLSTKVDLTTLYGPYAALSAFMAVDMFLRLKGTISRASAASSRAGTKKIQ